MLLLLVMACCSGCPLPPLLPLMPPMLPGLHVGASSSMVFVSSASAA
jgi:hypothetical protein